MPICFLALFGVALVLVNFASVRICPIHAMSGLSAFFSPPHGYPQEQKITSGVFSDAWPVGAYSPQKINRGSASRRFFIAEG